MIINNLGERKGLFGLYNLNNSLLREAKAGTQTGQESGGRSWCKCHGRKLLALHILLNLFLVALKSIGLGVELPTVELGLLTSVISQENAT